MRKLFNPKTKEHVHQLVENIGDSFIDTLNNATWMDESTKTASIDKVKAISSHIAYPTKLTNITLLENYYEQLNFNEKEHLLNVLRLRKFDRDYEFHQLQMPIYKTDWVEYAMPTAINAFYIHQQNSIRKCI